MKNENVLYSIRRKMQVVATKLTSPKFMSGLYFRIVLKNKLNLKNPRTFNEKLQWLKLYEWPNNELAIKCADKYLVREYIESKGYGQILNELIGAWDKAEEIDWSKLPNQFVLKCNHGCGYNILCKDKSKLDETEVKKKLSKWISEDFSLFNAEPHYGKIKRKIICEKYLGDRIINYNIYCFNGKVTFMSVAGGLGDGVDERLTYYKPNGEKADFRNKDYPTEERELSPKLAEMEKTAEELAKGFPMVRVDLYDIGGQIVFSEMTFTPGGALIKIEPYESDLKLGSMLDLSKEMNNSVKK